MMKPLRLVALGMMGRMPFAGLGWQVLQYLEGFRRLGHEVFYVEDTGTWPYDPGQRAITDDARYTVEYIARIMNWCGLADRWAYRSPSGRTFGMSESEVSHLLEGADALINLSGATVLRDEQLHVPVRIYLETDPVLPQIQVAQNCQATIDLLGAHTHHFTYAENLGAPDCGVPQAPFRYRTTRAPVVLEWWSTLCWPGQVERSKGTEMSPAFTTIGNWRQTGKDVEWNGETYTWSKHHGFLRFIDLPRRIGQPIELAISSIDPGEIHLLVSHGWRVVDALALSRDIHPYRDYIARSLGEFTVAKDQNVRLRSGWFSDRSACYLAAGRPVITQDTGFGNILPTGAGLFPFNAVKEIVEAFEAIDADYESQSRAARELAVEYFKAETILKKLLNDAGL